MKNWFKVFIIRFSRFLSLLMYLFAILVSKIVDFLSFILDFFILFKYSAFVRLQNFINLYSISKNIKIDYEKNQGASYNVNNYITSTKEFKTWIDIIYEKLKIHSFLGSVLIGFAIFALGLIYSYFIGFHINYLNTIPIYIGVFGVILTISTIRYGSTAIHKSYSQIRPCFFITDSQYKTFLEEWYLRLSNNSITIITSIFVSIGFILLASVPFYHFEIVENYNLTSFIPHMFLENGWIDDPNKDFKFFLLVFWAVIIAFPLVTSGRILVVNYFSLLDLRHIPIIPIPNLIRLRLKNVSTLYFIITFLWFIGVSLFGILFFNDIDIISTTIISIFSLLGVMTFLTPQIVYYKLLSRSERTASKWILASFYKKLDISLIEEHDNNFIKPVIASQKYKLETLVDYFDASIPVKRWVYSNTQILSFIVGQILTLISPKLIKMFYELIL